MELAYVNFYTKSMKSKFHRYLNLVVGIIIFFVIIGITYMIGFVLRKLNMKVGVRNDT